MSGVIKNISIAEYHKPDGFISASALKSARKSLAHFGHYLNRTETEQRKAHFDFGNAFEAWLLGGFDEKVHVMDETKRPEPEKDYRTKANAEWKAGILATIEQKGQYIIPAVGDGSFETIQAMGEVAKSKPWIEMIEQGEEQLSIFWQCPETGLKMKTRPDVVFGDCIIDIKTAEDGSPASFAKDCANYDYPIQALMQIEGVRSTGREVNSYYWAVFEKKAPYNATLYEFTWDDQEALREQYVELKRLASEAIQRNEFAGYDQHSESENKAVSLDLPSWYSIIKKNY
jgi:hypothetical protein